MTTAKVQIFSKYEDAKKVEQDLRSRGHSNATTLLNDDGIPPFGWMVRYNTKGRRQFYPEREQ